jgi:hypothetical protein
MSTVSIGTRRQRDTQKLSCGRTTSLRGPGVSPFPQIKSFEVPSITIGADSGKWSDYDETIAHRPPFHILVNGNNSKPRFSYTPPNAPITGNSLNLTVKVHDKAKLKSVHVYYKMMPAYYEWVPIEMIVGAGGNYTATVPLTPHYCRVGMRRGPGFE